MNETTETQQQQQETNPQKTITSTSTTTTENEGDASRVITLNIGGKIFVTTERTLLSSTNSDNFFTALLRGSFGHTHANSDDKAIFIDRDGEHFGSILTFLRTGQVNITSNRELDAIYSEADFYGISSLMDLINARRGGGSLLLTRLEPTSDYHSNKRTSRSESIGSSSSYHYQYQYRRNSIKSNSTTTIPEEEEEEPCKIVSLCSASNIVAARHHNSTVSCWRYEGYSGGWKPLMILRSCSFVLNGLVMRETKNSIEQMKNVYLCAWGLDGGVQLWDHLHETSSPNQTREWETKNLGIQLEHVRFLANTRFLVGLNKDGSLCKIADLRSPTVPAESVIALPPQQQTGNIVTCTVDADPFLFLGCSNGTVWELRQDVTTGSWGCDRVYTDAFNERISSLHCAAIADRQSAKLFLCIGTEHGTVKLCCKTVHSESDITFQILASVLGHHCEPISQVLITESVETGGLLFSSLSSSGYLRSWHQPLEQQQQQKQQNDQDKTNAPHVGLHVGAPSTAGVVIGGVGMTNTGNTGTNLAGVGGTGQSIIITQNQQLLQNQQRFSGGLRCVCAISHISGALSSNAPCSLPFSELVTFGRGIQQQFGKDSNIRKNLGQLLVASHINNSVTCYDINDFLQSQQQQSITVFPVDRMVTTACCIVASNPLNSDPMLVTGHTNGSLQVWDIRQLQQDGKAKPVDLTIYE